MSLELWLAFAFASALLLVMPGPTLLTVISYSLAEGRRARLPLVAGVALGDSTALFVSLIGLGSLLAASALAFTVVKWAGGLYLIWLGVAMLRAGVGREAALVRPAPATRWQMFANTWLVTALNPKGIVFFVAFLPQFLAPGQPVGPQLWILGATFVMLATVNATAYAVFAGKARRLLGSAGAQRGFNLAGGSLLTAAGVWALLARRPGS